MSWSLTSALVAALTEPFIKALGLLIWDKKWLGHGCSLNLFKNTLSTVGFIIAALIVIYAIPYNKKENQSNSKDDICYNSRSVLVPEYEKECYYDESSDDDDEESQPDLLFILFILLLTGTIGITIGDTFWLVSLKMIGARKVIVVDSLKPFGATLLGWLFLKDFAETNMILYICGLAVTMAGVLITALGSSVDEGENKNSRDSDSAVNSTSTDIDFRVGASRKGQEITGLATKLTNEKQDDGLQGGKSAIFLAPATTKNLSYESTTSAQLVLVKTPQADDNDIHSANDTSAFTSCQSKNTTNSCAIPKSMNHDANVKALSNAGSNDSAGVNIMLIEPGEKSPKNNEALKTENTATTENTTTTTTKKI